MTQLSSPQEFGNATSLAADNFHARRDAIDLIATMRAKTIRVVLFGRMIYLPDPTRGSDKAYMDGIHNALREQVEQMGVVRGLLTGTYTGSEIALTVREWIFRLAQTMPGETDEILHMIGLSEMVADATTVGGDALSKALDDYMTRGRNGFHDVATRFCNGLWTDLDAQRETAAQDAAQRSQAVSKILSRLEYIGKHVRLVSLNASVEAARAGDAGRGLAVIASEFKTLAEEIQSLATSARTEIETK